jgi:hypothetical protein
MMHGSRFCFKSRRSCVSGRVQATQGVRSRPWAGQVARSAVKRVTVATLRPSRVKCEIRLLGRNPKGRAFAGAPPCFDSLIGNDPTALAKARPEHPQRLRRDRASLIRGSFKLMDENSGPVSRPFIRAVVTAGITQPYDNGRNF